MTNSRLGTMPEFVRQLATDRFKPLYLVVDESKHVISASGDAGYYGYPAWKVGDDLTDVLDVLHGLVVAESIEIPFLQTPNRRSVNMRIDPNGDRWEIVFYDVSAERDQRQETQQFSNELAIVHAKQNELLEKLKTANEALAVKQREAEQASQMKSRFIANMSHEFRTPLSSIIGYSQLLRSSRVGGDLDNGNAAIDRAAKHLMSLVENLLEQAQLEIGETRLNPRATNVRNLAADLESFFASIVRTKAIELTVLVDRNVPQTVLCDPLRIQQIFINIVGNACKYTDQGSVDVNLTWTDGVLSAAIQDTGPGMGKKLIANVYVPFYREAGAIQSGAGLGLSITKQLLDIMGGRIELDSTLGLGTTVRVSLPAPVVAATAITSDFDSMAFDKEILVVEDDHDIFDILSVFLKESGYTIKRAKRPSIALEYCRERTPDVVLLDLNMPEMDGCALSKMLRSEGYAKPIVMLTASSLRSDRQRALDSGCSDFLVKPVSSTELLHVINLHWDRTSPTEREMLEQGYRATLDDHADKFGNYRDKLRDPVARNELIEMLHKIAGSSAMFNIMEVSNSACSFESSIAQHVDNGHVAIHELRVGLDNFIRVLRRAASSYELINDIDKPKSGHRVIGD